MSLLAVGQRLRRIGLGAVAAAALVVGAGAMAPAQAHDSRYGWWGHHEQHRHYVDHHRGRDMRMMLRVFGHLLHG